MRTNTRLVLPFFYALLISACSNNDNYPKEYIGFEKQFISHTYDTKTEIHKINIDKEAPTGNITASTANTFIKIDTGIDNITAV